jgi:hypothetical protein
LEYNGYSDWFLPSLDELNLMFINLESAGIVVFTKDFYWSSSELNNNNALGFNGDRMGADGGKMNNFYVRAIRAF